jgi:3-hydroxypropanoate dehydrogenase
MSSLSLDEHALNQIFRSAQSIHAFQSIPVTDETLQTLYELLKWGPTAFNAQPARYVFVRSDAGKARLIPTLSEANRDKTRAAPVTAIVAYDTQFYEHLPEQFPSARVLELFTGNTPLSEVTASRNGTLQGAYLLIAARAIGLTVGPMSGFNPEAVNREFFPSGRFRANFLVNLGYSDASRPRPRGPRLAFRDVAEVI